MNSENSITRLTLLSDLFGYAADGLLTRILKPEEVTHILKLAEAFWVYQGDPCKEKPHALLHSGNHSNGFVNVGDVIKKNPPICELFAHSLALLVLRSNNVFPLNIGWVTGADTSSTALAGYVAKFFDAQHVKMKKVTIEGKNIQAWSQENTTSVANLSSSSWGLQVEELITTAQSAIEVRVGIRLEAQSAPITFSSFLPTIVDRSDPDNPVKTIGNSTIISLLRLPIKNFAPGPGTCPYCAAGSEAIRPKEGENWKRLTIL